MASKPRAPAITFVSQTGEISIRLNDNQLPAICRAARDLKARYFIAREDGKWGVFDMRTAQQDTPHKGEWSINDPVKTFARDQLDAAVVWCIHMKGK